MSDELLRRLADRARSRAAPDAEIEPAPEVDRAIAARLLRPSEAKSARPRRRTRLLLAAGAVPAVLGVLVLGMPLEEGEPPKLPPHALEVRGALRHTRSASGEGSSEGPPVFLRDGRIEVLLRPSWPVSTSHAACFLRAPSSPSLRPCARAAERSPQGVFRWRARVDDLVPPSVRSADLLVAVSPRPFAQADLERSSGVPPEVELHVLPVRVAAEGP